MKLLLSIIVIFLAVLYIYTFIKIKRRKKNNIDAVGDFRRNYLKKDFAQNPQNNEYNQYLTKYNSSVDYIDKEEFLREISEINESKKPKPKKLEF